jgi:hypothetical protein
LDVHNVIPISNIAIKPLELEVYNKNGKILELANNPREFIRKCVLAGRCMCQDNKKQPSEEKVVDSDAISLYPSAMDRLYMLEGIPFVLTVEMLAPMYFQSHIFGNKQVGSTTDKFRSGFLV